MKNEKGITMVALVLTIIVMALLSALVIRIGTNELKNAELQDIVTNMLLIKSKVKIGIEELKFQTANLDKINDAEKIEQIKNQIKNSDEYVIGTKITNETPVMLTQLSDYLVDTTNYEWYYLTDEDLQKMGFYDLKNIKEDADDVDKIYLYGYSEITSNIEIVYTYGYEYKGKEYFKLSDLEKLTIDQLKDFSE